MGTTEEYFLFKIRPPPNLSKEHVGIWTGWCCKGDREVAREAAAKGIDISLVVLFLSLRKKISSKEAEGFFKEEVLVWVEELLDRKQIFRVSHILKNIDIDPEQQLSKVFYSTVKRDLREYIGNHLKKLNLLPGNMEQLWNFLDLILGNNALVSKYKLTEESIECLDKQRSEWKNEVAAKLFLRTFDNLLLPYLTGECIWKQLLMYKDLKLLKVWVNVTYNELDENYDVPQNLLGVFKTFSVTNDMINQLNESETSLVTCQVVLNEISKFGIFNEADGDDFSSILRRVEQVSSLQNIHEIVTKKFSNVSENTFYKLLIQYCLDNNLLHVLNTCVRSCNISDVVETSTSPHLELILDFRKLTSSFNESTLRDNLFIVSKSLCDDLLEYFNQNPLILLSLILFTKDLQFSDILNEKSLVISNVELFPCVIKLLENFKVVKVVHDRISTKEECSLDYYKLLKRHLSVDVSNLYSFQFESIEMPHFNSPNLVTTYGYSKKTDYLFYVRQLRPSIASKVFIFNEIKLHRTIGEESVKLAQKKIFKIAVRNFNCIDITASCVAFLEMLNVNADFLKVTIKAANVLLESGQDEDYLVELFMNIEHDSYAILNLLETTIINKIDFASVGDTSVFINAVKSYDLSVKFAIIHSLKLPEQFLKQCASNNMWLPFLIFAQIRNYPLDQIKITLQSLKNPILLEHISHSVLHDIQIEDSVLMRDRDSRTSFFSRIGVHKSLDSLNQSESIHSSITSQGSNSSSAGSDFLEIDTLNTKATLLQTLIRCHNSTDPPRALLQACQLYRNPLLAVLATSYEPDSIITNWLTWLAVSTELYHTFTNFEAIAVCATSVTDLLVKCMKHRFPKTLAESLDIFVSGNPLNHIADFLNACIDLNFDVAALKSKLKAFKESLCKCRRYSVLPETDHELTYLNNKAWLETTSVLLLSAAIDHNVTSLYNQIQFLQVLLDVDIAQYLPCPNIQNLLDILMNIYDSDCCIRFNVAQYFDVTAGRQAVVDCINKLLEQELFETAVKIATIEGLALDLILMKEWQYKYENCDHSSIRFWLDCSEQFHAHNIGADSAIDFYLDYVDKAHNNFEKYQLLQLAQAWASKFERASRYDIEKKKWMAYVVLEDKWKRIDEAVDESPANFTYKEMLEMLDYVSEYEEDISPDASNLLQQLLKEALIRGNFWLALKLEKMFRCRCSDLSILKLCFSLAEGILMPYQLDTEQRLLLTTGGHFRRLSSRRTFLSNRLSSLSSARHFSANASHVHPADVVDDSPVHDTLTLLYILTDKLTVGGEIAYKIFMTYRISLNIEIPYHVIVSNADYMKMLKDALEDDCMHKLDVVHDFIRVYRWSKDEIADFICEEIVNAASKYVKSKSDDFLMWNLKMDQEFHLVLQLLQENCSVLGYKIYSYASAVHKAQVLADLEFKISELALVIELLITAHDSFTADCNMEGISVILKKCKSVISHLLTLRSWKLIVRLLTGVARYTEMSYVFQILRENDQFEFLLRKGSRKDNALKVALLEYLKKYCPDNRELYKIVALHFTLFSEVAQLWEREAQSVIRNLIAISKLEMQNNKLNPDFQLFVLFTNTDGTRLCLNKAIENYTHATEFHLQGEKLAKAMNAAKQAELLALQISLLKALPISGTTVCLLNLNQAQVASLISTQLSFDQSLILVRAYSYQPDWASVLYEQCITRNNSAYLQSFLNHLSLTDSLVHDISRKFLNANINTANEIQSMKNVLTRLPSVHTKYRIASELGFTDLVEDLISGGQLAYLKDTVWQKGYKS